MFETSAVTDPPAVPVPGQSAAGPTRPAFDARPPFDPDLLVGVPSPETLAALFVRDPAALSSDDATALAIGCELGKRLLDGVQLQALASAAHGKRREKGDLCAPAHELAAATGLNSVTTSCRTDLACSVLGRLPTTLQLLQAGKLRLSHVEDIERATRTLTDEQARHIDAKAVPPGPMGLKKRLAEAIARLDPDILDKKAEQADADRDVTFWTDGIDGTSGVCVTGPVDKVAQIKAAIDSRARTRTPDDPRPLGARRFDVLYDWARQLLGLPFRDPDGNPNDSGGDASARAAASPTGPGGCSSCGRTGPSTIPINVTISLEALLHLSETPGALDGVPVPASVARQLAADGRWRRFVTETHTGRLLDVGANTYRPSDALLRFVRARNQTCVFPGCTRRAEQCDCDHTRPFRTADGPTIAANLAPVCRSHHRCKHELDWNYGRHPTDQVVWKAPSGRTYSTEPEYYADDPQLSAYLTAQSKRRQDRERSKRPPEPPDPGEPPF